MLAAPAKKVITHGDYFPLNRSIHLSSAKLPSEMVKEFETLLTNSGATIERSFFKQFFVPQIIFRRTMSGFKTIPGDQKVRITVSYKRVLVEYNCEKAALRGLELLIEILKPRNGAYVFEGVVVIDWATKAAKSGKQKLDGFDLSSSSVSKSSILGIIARSPAGSSYLLYGSTPTSWSIESRVMRENCPNWEEVAGKPRFSIADLAEIINAGKNRDVDVLLNVNLTQENDIFTSALGHSIYSVEGMRFARAIIEEYQSLLGLSEIAIGYIPAGIDEFYLQFLERVKELDEINFIYE